MVIAADPLSRNLVFLDRTSLEQSHTSKCIGNCNKINYNVLVVLFMELVMTFASRVKQSLDGKSCW
jgi:hypothetical protein